MWRGGIERVGDLFLTQQVRDFTLKTEGLRHVIRDRMVHEDALAFPVLILV